MLGEQGAIGKGIDVMKCNLYSFKRCKKTIQLQVVYDSAILLLLHSKPLFTAVQKWFQTDLLTKLLWKLSPFLTFGKHNFPLKCLLLLSILIILPIKVFCF